MTQAATTKPEFLVQFRGTFLGVLHWPDLDRFWEALRAHADKPWYIYAVGETPPTTPASREQLLAFIQEIDALLHKEHEEDYCGIVYADDHKDPTYIKIFDPHNLGVVCGFSNNPPLPGWVLSLLPPVDLPNALSPTNNRKRWWQRLFS